MIESEAIDVRAGDVHITPEQIGDVNIGTYGSGDYVLNTGNKIKAELVTNNTVRIFDGVMVYGGIRDAVPINKYYDLTIDNGTQGKNRNDIIVRRYTKDDDSQKKARSVFVVVKGTPTTGTASDPAISLTDIRSGALTHDMPLHRVRIEGLNIVAVEPLFDVLMPMSDLQDELAELNSKIETLNKNDQSPGSALKFRDATELGYTNLTFGYWAKGIYLYPGYLDGAPNDYGGLLLVFTDGTSFMKYAFAFDGNIYSMRQKVSDGTITQGWTKI